MDRINDLLNQISDAAQKTFDGKKRNELKNNDFLFPETRSFPIVSPKDVKDAISNYGRMSGKMDYDTFLHKLYNMCKRKGPEFVVALPEATKEKLGIKEKSKSDTTNPEDIVNNMDEYRNEFLEMSLASLKNIAHNVISILKHADEDLVKQNLTEPWLQGIIAITENNMSTIRDFVMLAEETDDDTSEGSQNDKPGLWENIRKKKERMGKNYRPSKRGDKGRPDPDQWKKLTK